MKNPIVPVICCMLLFSSAFSQTPNKKTNLFNDIKTLRLQYQQDEFYLYSMDNFGTGNRYSETKARLLREKAAIDSLDKKYISLLSKNELVEYTTWKKNEEMKDKVHDLGWWYASLFVKGC